MNITDPVADLLTRIRNAQMVKQDVVSVPASKLKIGIVHLLQQEGYVRAYKCIRDRKQGTIKIALKYGEGGESVITSIKRWSRPGRRYYTSKTQIPYCKNGFGIGVLSTSRGLMTDRQARAAGVGGEFLCSVY
jgi:small subunit ribosomal protein S8